MHRRTNYRNGGYRPKVAAFSGGGVSLGELASSSPQQQEPANPQARVQISVPRSNIGLSKQRNTRNYYNTFSGRGKTLGSLVSMNEHKVYKKVGNSYFGRKVTVGEGDEEEEETKFDGDNTCLICYEKEGVALFDPCNHGGFCSDCVKMLRTEFGKCPVCKDQVGNIVYYEVKDGGILEEMYTKDFYEE